MALEKNTIATSCKTTLKVGDVLNNKWVILGFIGKGGMGEVYRAHQSNLNRDVAIKVISREWLKSLEEGDEEAETLVQRFRREVQAMAQLRHPNILQVFDHDAITVEKCGQDTSIEYIAMEYIPGGSLRDTMSEEGFYPDEDLFKAWVSRYYAPVLTGVMALHDNGIVHRDLKPENILMDQDTPKIADFGLARSNRLKPVTQSMDVKGSPHYMSPEHFFDFKRADQRADVYSLGKILFEAVDGKIKSGTTPFKSAKLAKTESPFFQELDRIIQKATAESKDERTESVRELLGQLEPVIYGLEPKKQTENPPRKHAVPLFLQPKWIWAGILVAVLSVISITVWHLMGEPGMGLFRSKEAAGPGKHQTQLRQDNGTGMGTADTGNATSLAEHLGKQRLIPGGTFSIPAVDSESDEQSVQIEPFYMDEFLVTNQQFVDFLNHNLSQITMESGVAKGGGANWLLLGEVFYGYEPIVYQNNEFHVSDPAYASSPVLRVTGYGASAFANYFGRRLPTGVELLYTIAKGSESSKQQSSPSSNGNEIPAGDMRREPGAGNTGMEERPEENATAALVKRNPHAANSDASTTPILLLGAAAFAPNLLGIKGLDLDSGEWVYHTPSNRSGNPLNENFYAVIGGAEGAPKDMNLFPMSIKRFPWEGCEDVGFRTVKSATDGNPEKQAGTK